MNKKSKVLFVSIITNIILVIIKVLGGIIGHSRTLVVDGIHSLSDFSTDIFSLLGIKFSSKPADEKHPFGHGKLENIVSLFIGIIIIFIGLVVLRNSLLFKPVTPSTYLILLTLITITTKYLVSSYMMKKGKKYNSPILISNAKESKMDVLSSIFALIILVLVQFSTKIHILKYIDIAGGVIISLFIIYMGIQLIKEQADELIGKEEKNEILKEIITNSTKEQNIEIKSIKSIKYGNKFVCLVEIYLDSKLSFIKANDISNKLEERIKEEQSIEYVMIKMIPKSRR